MRIDRHGRHRWRHYETAAGNRPVLDFIRKVPDEDKAAILAAIRVPREPPGRMSDSLSDISKRA